MNVVATSERPWPQNPLGSTAEYRQGDKTWTGTVESTGRVCRYVLAFGDAGEEDTRCHQRSGWTEEPSCGHQSASFFAAGTFDDGTPWESIF